MQERLAAETAETAKPPAAPVAHGSPVVLRMLALQRCAGNRAVTRMLAREPVADKAPDFAPARFVFILGPEGDAALKSAVAYYTSALMSSPFMKVITRRDMSDPTLSGVFDYLNAIRYPLDEISLVTTGAARASCRSRSTAPTRTTRSPPTSWRRRCTTACSGRSTTGRSPRRPGSGTRPASPATARRS
jgi:hypothetical protein